MGGKYMINIWRPLKVAQFGQKCRRWRFIETMVKGAAPLISGTQSNADGRKIQALNRILHTAVCFKRSIFHPSPANFLERTTVPVHPDPRQPNKGIS